MLPTASPSYLMPTKYALSGSYYNYLHGVDFLQDDGGSLAGDQLLDEDFHVSYGDEVWRKWTDLVIVLAFVVVFRAQHFILMMKSTSKLGETLSSSAVVATGQPLESVVSTKSTNV